MLECASDVSGLVCNATRIVVNNRWQRIDGALQEGLLIYSTRDGKLERVIDYPHECRSQYLLEGTRLLCGRWEPGNKINFVLIDIATGDKLAEFLQVGQRLEISPDGRSFATAQCAYSNDAPFGISWARVNTSKENSANHSWYSHLCSSAALAAGG